MNSYKIAAAALGLLVLAGSGAAVYADGGGPLRNASFEEQGGGSPAAWSTSAWDGAPGSTEFTAETDACHSGSGCVKVNNHKENDARYVQEVPVVPNSMYKLSAWIKAQHIGAGRKGASLSVEGKAVTTPDIDGSDNDWHYVEMYAITNENASSLRLTLGIGGYGQLNTGEAWFDDAAIEPVSAVPANAPVVYLPDDPASAVNAAGLPPAGDAAASAERTGWHHLSRGPRTGMWIVFGVLLAIMAAGTAAYRRLGLQHHEPQRHTSGRGR